MNPILILQHQENDGPAYLETWLNDRKIPSVIYRSDLHTFPESIIPYSALAILGGAISANDRILNNLQTQILILQAIHLNIPVLGHCLGGQLLAKALGAKIVSSPKPEIGWQTLKWEKDSEEWFGQNPTTHVMHWHYEAFELPVGAKLLASSSACPNQAFSIGNNIGMQFHIEVTEEKVNTWTNEIEDNWFQSINKWDTVHDRDRIKEDNKKYISQHQKTASTVYQRWLTPTTWKSKF